MELTLPNSFFFVILAALAGGLTVKLLRLQPIIGYILAGVIFGAILPMSGMGVEKLAEIGAILLLFSVGIEMSLTRLARVAKVAFLGAGVQIVLVIALGYFLLTLFGIDPITSLILSAGFSLSSTAVVVKILSDRGETDTVHGEIMIGWLLVQDLAVIPLMVILPALTSPPGGALAAATVALGKAAGVVLATVLLGRILAPFLIHKVAAVNSRELLVLAAVSLAIGTALFTSLFGISPALGAFLAGIVISESQENHAVFAETRPLRDLFVALFFVTLGFLVRPEVVVGNFGLILALAGFVLLVKFLVVFFVSLFLGYHGKTAIAASFGLSQVGEFAFIIFSSARGFGLLSERATSIGIATALVTLLVTPVLFKSIVPFWRRLRLVSVKWPALNKLLLGWDKKTGFTEAGLKEHIIIVGYGRVGRWIGKALNSIPVPFVVVEYNQEVVNKLKNEDTPVIYGDPMEAEVIDAAGILDAKAIVIAIPDRVAAEELIAHVQTVAPLVKIITRAHLDEDVEKLKLLKVDSVVQPEFEASVTIVREILNSMGRPKEEIKERIKKLRLSRAKS